MDVWLRTKDRPSPSILRGLWENEYRSAADHMIFEEFHLRKSKFGNAFSEAVQQPVFGVDIEKRCGMLPGNRSSRVS